MTRYAVLGAAMILCTATAPATDKERFDHLTSLGGVWEVVDPVGDIALPCSGGQSFRISEDRTEVILNELGTDWISTYRVISNSPAGLHMAVIDEDRLTDAGEHVTWWVHYEGEDRFRWRRDDWAEGALTATVWRRCDLDASKDTSEAQSQP